MTIKAAAFSTKGIRPHNEDSFLLNSQIGGTGTEDSMAFIENLNEGVFVVADGMGGHAAGDVASNFVVSEFLQSITSVSEINTDFFNATMSQLHQRLLAKGKNEGTANMGSTFVSLVIKNDECGFCSIGDSRLYRYRNGFVQQLSHDDSLSEIIPDAPKNIVTNAMGAGLSDVEIETRFSASFAVAGDKFVLCSDGVHGHVSDDEMEQILQENFSLVEKTRSLVEKALENGSDDNSTAIIIELE